MAEAVPEHPDDPRYKTLGGRIKAMRERRVLGKRELARAAGYSEKLDPERADANPTYKNLVGLVRALRVNGHWLLTGEGFPEAFVSSRSAFEDVEPDPADMDGAPSKLTRTARVRTANPQRDSPSAKRR